MNILRVKLLVAEPEYYRAKGNNKDDGITEYSNDNSNGCTFFKTDFCMPVHIFHDLLIKVLLKIISLKIYVPQGSLVYLFN